MTFKKSTLATLFSITLISLSPTVTAATKEINVVRMSAPGAVYALWTDAVTERLQTAGYKVNLIGTNSCREAMQWIDSNKEKPMITFQYNYQIGIGLSDKSNPAGCPLEINENTLVGIMGKWYHFLCGHDGVNTVDKLRKSNNAKIASSNNPIQNKILADQLEDIGVKNFKIISYAKGKDQVQSYIAKDTDYIIFSTESSAKQFPGSCFLTTAPEHIAKTMHNGQDTGRTTYKSLNQNVRHDNMGLWPVLVSYNTDISDLRSLLKNASPNSLLGGLIKNYEPVNESIPEQIEELKQIGKILN